MTLAIDRFATRCRASPRAAAERGRIERVVRTDFVEHCGRELATAFRGHEGVIRIRRLALKLALPRAGLGDVALARNWAASFAVSLRRALASPEGGAIEIRRYASRADWQAAAIAAALAGELSGRWEFAELRWIGALPLGDALRRILDLDGSLAGDVLIRLRQRGHLEALLLNLDEVALEQLQRRLDDGARGADPVDVDALIECAELVLREPWRSERLVSRRRAIALWASLVERPGRRQSLGRVSDALVALDVLNRVFADAHRDDLASRLLRRVRDEASPTGAAAALSAVLAALESAASGHAAARELVQQLTDALRGIAGVFPPPRSAESAHVVASAFAGLLLLVPTIVRLGWLQALRKTRVWQAHGARTLTYVLAGVASELVGREGDALDPGAALLAGWIGEPDVAGFRRFVERLDGGACAELAHALALAEAHDATTLTTQAADRLVAEFAARIRGFGTAGRAFVVDKLLAVAGEIVIDERRVTVALAACPYHVALHVCSAFESLGAVEWLGGRELVFRPGAA